MEIFEGISKKKKKWSYGLTDNRKPTFTQGNTQLELCSQGRLHPTRCSNSQLHPAWLSHVSYLLCHGLDFSFCALLMEVRALEGLNGMESRQRIWENGLECLTSAFWSVFSLPGIVLGTEKWREGRHCLPSQQRQEHDDPLGSSSELQAGRN